MVFFKTAWQKSNLKNSRLLKARADSKHKLLIKKSNSWWWVASEVGYTPGGEKVCVYVCVWRGLSGWQPCNFKQVPTMVWCDQKNEINRMKRIEA